MFVVHSSQNTQSHQGFYKKLTLGLTALSVAAFSLFGCSKSDTDLAGIKSKGVLVVGTEAGYPPFEFIVKKDGTEEFVGIDIELAKMIAEKIGVKLEIKNMPFDGLIPALQAKKIDMIIAGMTPTEERAKAIDFTHEYFTSSNSLVVAQNSTIATLEDLKGKNIGAQLGTTQAEIAHNKIPGAIVKELPYVPDLIEQVKSGKLDAIVVSNVVAKGYLMTNDGQIKVSIPQLPTDNPEVSAMAMNKNQPELLKAVNDLIASAKADGSINKAFDASVAMQLEQMKATAPTTTATAQ